MGDRSPPEILIAGAGYAALEAAFRLQRVAGAAIRSTILAPDTHVTAHPMAALAPFAAGQTLRVPLAELADAAGATLRHGRLAAVDAAAHRVVTEDGEAIAASWPLPLYELALMTAERAYGLCQRDELMLLTAEQAPLAIFGAQASRALAARLYRPASPFSPASTSRSRRAASSSCIPAANA